MALLSSTWVYFHTIVYSHPQYVFISLLFCCSYAHKTYIKCHIKLPQLTHLYLSTRGTSSFLDLCRYLLFYFPRHFFYLSFYLVLSISLSLSLFLTAALGFVAISYQIYFSVFLNIFLSLPLSICLFI